MMHLCLIFTLLIRDVFTLCPHFLSGAETRLDFHNTQEDVYGVSNSLHLAPLSFSIHPSLSL